MPTPTETVAAFLALSGQAGGMARAMRDCVTPGTVRENGGCRRPRGPRRRCARRPSSGSTADSLVMRVDTPAIAAQDNKVLTERIDPVTDGEGRSVMGFPLTGIFEVKAGKIATGRDCFDPAALGARPSA